MKREIKVVKREFKLVKHDFKVVKREFKDGTRLPLLKLMTTAHPL